MINNIQKLFLVNIETGQGNNGKPYAVLTFQSGTPDRPDNNRDFINISFAGKSFACVQHAQKGLQHFVEFTSKSERGQKTVFNKFNGLNLGVCSRQWERKAPANHQWANQNQSNQPPQYNQNQNQNLNTPPPANGNNGPNGLPY